MSAENTIYVSYARSEHEFVRRLVKTLQEFGYPVVFDKELQSGDSWFATLSKAIRSSGTFLVALSPGYLESSWSGAELSVALRQEGMGQTHVIPLVVKECDAPISLVRQNSVDFTGDFASAVQNLREQLPKPLKRKGGRQSAAERRPARDSLVKATRKGAAKKKCFVVMPFKNEDLNVVYEYFVRPILEDYGFECKRGDEVFGGNQIMDDILHDIDQSELILADLSGWNPNVLYEVGICHARNKPVLLLTQSKDAIPFDLSARRVLIYDYTPGGCKKLERELLNNIRAVLEKRQ